MLMLLITLLLPALARAQSIEPHKAIASPELATSFTPMKKALITFSPPLSIEDVTVWNGQFETTITEFLHRHNRIETLPGWFRYGQAGFCPGNQVGSSGKVRKMRLPPAATSVCLIF